MGFEDGQRWLAWVQSRSLYEKLYGRTWPLSKIVKDAFDHGYKFVFIKLPASNDDTTESQLSKLQYNLPTFEIRQSQSVKSKRMSLMIIKKPLTDT